MASAAVAWTLDRAGLELVGRNELMKSFGKFSIERQGRPDERLGQLMYENFWKMQETLRIISLGLNYADYVYYEETVMDLGLFASFAMRGDNFKTSHNPHLCILGSTAEYLVSYAMDTVLQIENLVGDLDSPFGKRLRMMGHSEPKLYPPER